jgi:hypothetical protein
MEKRLAQAMIRQERTHQHQQTCHLSAARASGSEAWVELKAVTLSFAKKGDWS